MHLEAFRYVQRIVKEHGPFGRVVEIGSRHINGSIRPLFNGSEYVGVDIAPGPGVDVVCDGAEFEPGELVDCVVCAETLEHAENASQIVANAYQCLRPGGLLILTAAAPPRAPHSAVDGGPLREGEFYHNVTLLDLTTWLDWFSDVDVSFNEQHGDIYALGVK